MIALSKHLIASLEALAPEALEPPFAAVAWSGGADSTALLLLYLDAIEARHGSPPPSPILALTVDHRLREGSSEDARHCQAIAASLGEHRVRCEALSLPEGPQIAARGGSGEGPARRGRYRVLGEAARGAGVSVILTAHHSDDNLESLLLALVRGAGLTGLAGIRPRIGIEDLLSDPNGQGVDVVRPMLGLTRDSLIAWLRERGVAWRQDPTNALLDRRRNIMRHEIIPRLAQIGDGEGPMHRTVGVLSGERAWIEAMAAETLEGIRAPRPVGYVAGVSLWRKPLYALGRGLGAHVVRGAVPGYPPDKAAIERLWSMLEKPPSGTKTVAWPGGQKVEVLSDRVVIGAKIRCGALPEPMTLSVPGSVVWGPWRIETRLKTRPSGQDHISWGDGVEHRAYVEMFDSDNVALPLKVRPPQPGERLRALLGNERPLSRWLIDHKVPRVSRPWVAIVEDAQGRALWAAPVIRGQTAAIETDSTHILIVELLQIGADRDD